MGDEQFLINPDCRFFDTRILLLLVFKFLSLLLLLLKPFYTHFD